MENYYDIHILKLFCRSSKWYVTLEEYPFDRYPPFITAGIYAYRKEKNICGFRFNSLG